MVAVCRYCHCYVTLNRRDALNPDLQFHGALNTHLAGSWEQRERERDGRSGRLAACRRVYTYAAEGTGNEASPFLLHLRPKEFGSRAITERSDVIRDGYTFLNQHQ